MNWFKKKLVSMFTSEHSEIDEEIKIHTEKTIYPDKNIETKVAFQYPKGNFRFPLIPDENIQKPFEQRESTQFSQQVNKPKQKRPMNEKENEKENKKEKRPFQPTKVPSPIYGYKERTKKENKEEDVVEFEIPLQPEQYIVEEEISTSFIEEKNSQIEMISDKVHTFVEHEELDDEELENVFFEKEIIQAPQQPNPSFMQENLEIKSVTHADKTEDVVENNELSYEADDTSKVITEHESQSVIKKELVPDEKKKLIPYNVIMLKQDKKKHINNESEVKREGSYVFPSEKLLLDPPNDHNEDKEWIDGQQILLDETFENFNVRAKVVNVTQGPAVTRFEVHPEPGVKVNKVTNLMDDIKLNLAAKDIRIEAPIPGKNTIGIEVPNRFSKPVMLKEIIQSPVFKSSPSPLTVALGFDIAGKSVVTDLNKMPHGLIAGATGSGKSVCINAMLISLLYKASPHQVKLLLIDPKMVELAPYNHIPHLVSPVITDVKAATQSLKWAVEEMERRYEMFAAAGVRDIARFNELVKLHKEPSGELPYLVIIIDELADLMMVAPSDVEEAICRIAQKARACGIHLIIATQRPSVDVITGLIKANIPTRIAFSVSSQVDSRTIIDMSGAERLLGKGDMLFLENGSSKPIRVQGNFVSDEEIERIVDHVKSEMEPSYFFEQQDLIKKSSTNVEEDELYYDACEFIINQGGASTSSLQRNFRIGYNRAARLIDMMEEQGIISEARGSKPRDVLISEEELITIQEN